MAQKPVAQYFLGDIRFPENEREKILGALKRHGFQPRIELARPGECIIRNTDDPWSGEKTIKDALRAEGLLFQEERLSAQG